MKNIYLITVISLLLFGCSKDSEEIIEEEIINSPTVESISEEIASEGDVITLKGKNFKSNEVYIIKFNGIEGVITEIQDTFLKVTIPKNATSGEITLTHNGITTVIGTIEIKPLEVEEIPKSTLYAYKRGDSQSIVEINVENGTEVSVIATLGDEYYNDMIYNEVSNEIISYHIVQAIVDPEVVVDPKEQKRRATGPEQAFLYKVNVQTGGISQVEIDPSFYEDIVITREGRLYAYKRGDSQSIVEINTEDGSEVSTIATLGDEYYNDMVYNEVSNEIISYYIVQTIVDPEVVVDPKEHKRQTTIPEQAFIHKINVQTGGISQVEIDPSFYEDIVITKEGKLYAYKREGEGSQSIVEINIENGTEVSVIATLGGDYYNDMIYNEASNEIISYYINQDITTEDPNVGKKLPLQAFLYKINILTGETSELEIDPSQYADLIIHND